MKVVPEAEGIDVTWERINYFHDSIGKPEIFSIINQERIKMESKEKAVLDSFSRMIPF